MVELFINGNAIELPSDTDIKYTKQISDIFDLANVSCSFTNSFSFEKTPANTQTMGQLGIKSDGSNLPYQKNTAVLKVDGFDLISNGWYKVSPTDEKYNGSIIDGMVDFFKAIENKTIGSDLDLKNFNHEKTIESVVDSFSNFYYQYIIADYGGKTNFNNGFNIDYLAPCFSVKKIWELIFSTFNFKCDYSQLSYLDNLYLTYPKDVAEDQTNEIIATLEKTAYTTRKGTIIGDYAYPKSEYFWSSSFFTEGSLIQNWRYVIEETGSYNFDLTVAMYCYFRRINYYSRQVDVAVFVLKNGQKIGEIGSSFEEGNPAGEDRNIQFNLSCDAGDVITLEYFVPFLRTFRGQTFYAQEWRHRSTIFKIFKTDLGTTKLENELKDFSIKDFIKEIIWRTGLTPILNPVNNTVEFSKLSNRLNFANAQDLSHCYVRRTSEVYENGYAQKNIFKLKRESETDLSGDGFLYVQNSNLEDQKILATSKIYAPDKKILTPFGSFSTNQYKIWETETKETDGVIEISYKGLSGRFYFIRKETANGTFKIISENLVGEEIVNTVPYAVNVNTLFDEAVYNNYQEYQKLLTRFRIHNIDLVLTVNDFLGIDLTKPFYFSQENAYYICNKISFEQGGKSSGEFIKINQL